MFLIRSKCNIKKASFSVTPRVLQMATPLDIKQICSKISSLRQEASKLSNDAKTDKDAEKKWSSEIVRLETQLNEYWKTQPVFQVTLAIARVARDELFQPNTEDEMTHQNARRVYEGINTENKMSPDEEKLFEQETAEREAQNMEDQEYEMVMQLLEQKGTAAMEKHIGVTKLAAIRRIWEEKQQSEKEKPVVLDEMDVAFLTEYAMQTGTVTASQEKYMEFLLRIYPKLWEMPQVKHLRSGGGPRPTSPTPPCSPVVIPAPAPKESQAVLTQVMKKLDPQAYEQEILGLIGSKK